MVWFGLGYLVAGPRPLGSIDVPDYWMSDDFDTPLDQVAYAFDPR